MEFELRNSPEWGVARMAMLSALQEAGAGGLLESRSLRSPPVTQSVGGLGLLGCFGVYVYIRLSLVLHSSTVTWNGLIFLVPSQHVTENESHWVFMRWAEVLHPFYGRKTEAHRAASWAPSPTHP